MLMYVLLIVGFILLIKGADIFVEGSSSVAKLMRVPSIIIGLTIVAFGTSAPEAAVSISASMAGNNDIAVGNVIGSNLFNLLVVVGACGLIRPMAVDRGILKKEFPFSIIVSGILLVMIMFDLKIDRAEGVILLGLFVFFVYRTVMQALNNRVSQEEELKTLTPLRSAVYILVGLVAIVFGGDLVVDSASKIAETFGLSQTLIGLTIVAMGTSLPELVTSIVASRKGENGLALGNVIGSNIFNILLVLAASAVISPIRITMLSVYDAAILLVVSVIALVLAKTREEINRKEGIFMLLVYVVYMVYIILR